MLASRTATRLGCWRGARLPRARYLHDLHKHPQSRFLQVSEEVRDAVATGKPVVALETTIYTHGVSSNLLLSYGLRLHTLSLVSYLIRHQASHILRT
jgi:hypothetical protein